MLDKSPLPEIHVKSDSLVMGLELHLSGCGHSGNGTPFIIDDATDLVLFLPLSFAPKRRVMR